MVGYEILVSPNLVYVWAYGKREKIGMNCSTGTTTIVTTGFRVSSLSYPKDDATVEATLYGEFPDDDSIITTMVIGQGRVEFQIYNLEHLKYLKIYRSDLVDVRMTYNGVPVDLAMMGRKAARWVFDLIGKGVHRW